MLTAFGATPTAGVQCSSFGGLALRRIKTPQKERTGACSRGDLRTQAWLWLIAITQDIQVIEACRVRFAPQKVAAKQDQTR